MYTKHRARLGRAGEDLAAATLEEAGYEILERNWRDGRNGELDLVARGPTGTVVVEVRTRVGQLYGTALESVDARKIAQLRSLAAIWARRSGLRRKVRVDVVAITVPASARRALIDRCQDEDRALDLRELGASIEWVEAVS